MDIKNMKYADIVAWCAQNHRIDWLKAKTAEKVEVKVYPTTIDENGKKVIDKSQEPTIELRPITFIQLKAAFIDTFMPEARPSKKAKKKPTMADYIATLPNDADLTDEAVAEILAELFGEYEADTEE